MRRAVVAMVAALVFAACDTLQPPSSAIAPDNECPAHPCQGYAPLAGPAEDCLQGPCCKHGVCLVEGTSDDIVLLIDVPQSSSFAPGRTIVTRLADVLALAPSGEGARLGDAGTQPQGAAAGAALLDGPLTVVLPRMQSVQDQYAISPSATANSPSNSGLGYDLGNPQQITAMPVQATFRRLWPGTSPTDPLAESVGLPVAAVLADSTDVGGAPGPAGGTAATYTTYLPQGIYQRILQPTPPFDQRIPPEISAFSVTATGTAKDRLVQQFDTTLGEQMAQIIPVFTLSSDNGPLDGWTAYLRDQTGLVISNVYPLSGAVTANAVITTKRGGDAFAGASLVLAPPPGMAVPTAVFSLALGGSFEFTYLALPNAVPVSGTVLGQDGQPVDADVFFEATAITAATGTSYPSNFEYAAMATTSFPEANAHDASFDAARGVEASSGGAGAFTASLPVGQYRVSIRPHSAEYAVVVLDDVSVPAQASGAFDFVVGPLPSVAGSAVIDDARPLAYASIDAVPVGCSTGSGTACLPRPSQTTTASNGTFTLALDPGQYILRVRPAPGTRLPWVVKTLSVTRGPSAPQVVRVPAPQSLGLTLLDPNELPIARANVRAFWVPATGLAIEIGSALTDDNGTYELYATQPLSLSP